MVPMMFLMAAIALGWPKFAGMFRCEPGGAAVELAIVSVATAAFLGAAGLAFQQFGVLAGGTACALAIGAGQFLPRRAGAARFETALAAMCLAIVIAGRTADI